MPAVLNPATHASLTGSITAGLYGRVTQAILPCLLTFASSCTPNVTTCSTMCTSPFSVFKYANLRMRPARQVAADAHAEVHAALHALALRLQRDLEGRFREGAGITTDEGAAVFESVLEAATADLRYNPRRYFSWDRMACAARRFGFGVYKEPLVTA